MFDSLNTKLLKTTHSRSIQWNEATRHEYPNLLHLFIFHMVECRFARELENSRWAPCKLCIAMAKRNIEEYPKVMDAQCHDDVD